MTALPHPTDGTDYWNLARVTARRVIIQSLCRDDSEEHVVHVHSVRESL